MVIVESSPKVAVSVVASMLIVSMAVNGEVSVALAELAILMRR